MNNSDQHTEGEEKKSISWVDKALNESMLMKGGNTEREKDFYEMGFRQGWNASQSSAGNDAVGEVERLKKLIEKEFRAYHDIDRADERWQQFKSENKI